MIELVHGSSICYHNHQGTIPPCVVCSDERHFPGSFLSSNTDLPGAHEWMKWQALGKTMRPFLSFSNLKEKLVILAENDRNSGVGLNCQRCKFNTLVNATLGRQ